MEPTREQRLGNLRDDNYIKYVIENIPLKDFDYKYVCNFDEEVKLLINLIVFVNKKKKKIMEI